MNTGNRGARVRAVLRSLPAIAALGLIAACPIAAQAQAAIKVLCDAPLRPPMATIGEAFRRDGGDQVEFVFAAPPAVRKRVADGEVADVLLADRDTIEALAKTGRVVGGDHPVLGRVGIGLAVRAGAPVPDIATTAALRRAVLDADSLAYNELASGLHFAAVLDRLGIAASVQGKTARYPSGAGVFEHLVKRSGNDIGVSVITVIRARKDLTLVGPLPAEVQSYTVYAAAPLSSAASPAMRGKAFMRFLTTPEATAALGASGVEQGSFGR